MVHRACWGTLLVAATIGLTVFSFAPAEAQVPALNPPVAQLTPETLTDAHVVDALQRGVDYVLQQQAADGTWENDIPKISGRTYTGGTTAVATYTLLHVGESLDDPRLRAKSAQLAKAIGFLRTLDSELVYVKSMQLCALSMVTKTTPEKQLLAQLAAPLVSGTTANGGYLYKFKEANEVSATHYDNSNSQLALLAAWAVADAGIEIPTSYWDHQLAYWKARQNTDGGWGYSHGTRTDSFESLAAAGVASMFILSEQLDRGYMGLTAMPNPTLTNGLAWLDSHYSTSNPFDQHEYSAYYDLYCLERAGLASGYKYLNKLDWYRIGAVELLQRQAADGSFPNHRGINEGDSKTISTCFALIFLARGRNPIAFNKLEYTGNTWNARMRDVANITHYLSVRRFEHPMNWQVVNLQSDPVEWMDAPILVITGSADPKFSDADIAKLRAFVNAGGMIFSSSDGASPAFTAAFQKYAAKMVDNRYEVRQLPKEHTLYTVYSKSPDPPRLLGLSNGARELWIHSPADMAGAWQRLAYASKEYWDTPANLYFYAAGGGNRLQTRLLSYRTPTPQGAAARSLSLARVSYPSNEDPEPGAWPRFAKIIRASGNTDLQLTTVPTANLDVAKTPVAHLTGTTAFKIPDPDVVKLKAYLAAGGALVIDNCGGGEAFDKSVKELVAVLYPDVVFDSIPGDSPVLNGSLPDTVKIDQANYRKFTLTPIVRRDVPNLLGIKQGDRYTVIYSPMDITSGFLDTQTCGINGYAPDTAQNLARDILIYAASKAPAGSGSGAVAASTAPATVNPAPQPAPPATPARPSRRPKKP